ncbi:ArsR/SmtB family transcription factor [Mycolicibacterium komossense]|uniref:Helix-turn-helix transcriptional regulator n=1 Tax=Mycolicibacterium komossense TaxID=1779 RepID=A0ABT3CCT7_9MYCO|nr:metalloregulator ArsR/SmtB family transcription factor [Mycolicibacterium komossense]MCV7227302.1 helix-turn-helix transcriptional regulator [Mycolicibacterium komossense]
MNKQPPASPAALISPEKLYDTANLFGLLSATARLHIVWLLADGEHDVGTLAEATGHSMATVSQHLSKLKLAGVVRARRDGRRQVYLVEDAQVVNLVRTAFGEHRQDLTEPARRLGNAR